ncbi:hypothetical protein DF027_00510 [Burkholderia cenocepacia]|nr:hypothetical protein DF028_03320 [Burkholderia cenocepacia]RQV52782.1 hypothetical protein DF027_00510 [Burkholderia cenocepacia]RQV82207.1 hypothetical protein DF010_05545 [Burkholderia cenocepacia]
MSRCPAVPLSRCPAVPLSRFPAFPLSRFPAFPLSRFPVAADLLTPHPDAGSLPVQTFPDFT